MPFSHPFTEDRPASEAKPLVSTRQATIADLDALARLFDAYRQFYGQDPNLHKARRFLAERLNRQESMVLLAADSGADTATACGPASNSEPVHPCPTSDQLQGFCQLYPSFCSVEAQPIFVLYDLFVAPCARRNGVGKALLVAAEQLAITHGKVRLDLTTARTNLSAQALYESLGWEQDRVFLGYSKRVRQG